MSHAYRQAQHAAARGALEYARVAEHIHHCRLCAASFSCELPNRYCPTLCKPCGATDEAQAAAFWRWWEGQGGVQFTESELAALTTRGPRTTVNRAALAFAAGFRAAREQKETGQ